MKLLLMFIVLMNLSPLCRAQSSNLLLNRDADPGAASWRAFGGATVEATAGNTSATSCVMAVTSFRTLNCGTTLRASTPC